MKKLSVLMMSVMMVLSLSGLAIGQDVVPEDGAKLLVWDEEGARLEYLKVVAEAFTAKYGVPIEFEAVSGMAAGGRLAQDGPAGTAGDVVSLNHDRLVDLYQSGIIMENLVNAEQIKADAMPAAVQAVTMEDGNIYAFPHSIGTNALIYNKDLVPNAPATMEELVQMGKEHTKAAENLYGILFDFGTYYIVSGFVGAKGGYLFGNHETDVTDLGLSKPEAIAGLEEMLKLKEISLQNFSDYNYNVMTGLFNEGKVAFIMNGPWALDGLKKAGINFGVAPIPTIDGKHFPAFATIEGYAVNSYTQYPRAAQLFAQMATSEEMLLKRFEMTGQLPPVKTVLDNPAFASDEHAKGFLEQAQYAIPMPNVPELRFIWDPTKAAFADIWNGKESVKDALSRAEKVVKEQIEAYRQ